MIPVAFKAFLARLLPATELGEIRWREAEAISYFCNHNGHTLTLSRHFDYDREVSSIRFSIETSGKITPFTVYNYEEADYSQMDGLFDAVIANANEVHLDLDDFFADPQL